MLLWSHESGPSLSSLWLSLGLLFTCPALPLAAQTLPNGFLTGRVTDEQGIALPGAVVSLESTDAPGTFSHVTDLTGRYRIADLPPGEYRLSVALTGFTTLVQDGLSIRAGLHLTQNFTLRIAPFNEVVEVKHDPPLLESRTATQAVNISGALQRQLPLSNRHNWSDFLIATPGVISVEEANNSRRFYLHGSSATSHVLQLDGADIGPAVGALPEYVSFNTDAIQDVQIKMAGVDASAPLGIGAIVNVAARSGTNTWRGVLSAVLQGQRWSDNNTDGGTSSRTSLVQPDVSLGGPLRPDHVWIYGAYRYSRTSNGINRSAERLAILSALDPSFTPFDNSTSGHTVFVKPTVNLSTNHRLSGFYQYDERPTVNALETTISPPPQGRIGGAAVALQVQSTWRQSLTTRIGASYNDKHSKTGDFDGRPPSFTIYRTVLPAAGRLIGQDQLAAGGTGSRGVAPFHKSTLSLDTSLTPRRWLGLHELQAGLYVQRAHAESQTVPAPLPFQSEDYVLNDPSNPAAGRRPFYRLTFAGATSVRRDASNLAVYVQDSWRPVSRLGISLGLRVDHVRQVDDLCRGFGFDMNTCRFQKSTELGPRFGVNVALTEDYRTIARFSAGRIHQGLTTTGTSTANSGPEIREDYDLDLNGLFETVFITPAVSSLAANREISSGWHQPYVDEWSAGLSRQFPGRSTLNLSVLRRTFRERATALEINRRFDGRMFVGYVDESRNDVFSIVNNSWNWPVVTELSATATTELRRVRLLGGYTRQWRHLGGTWQPHDPAGFIQPDAFPNDRGIGLSSGSTAVSEGNSLSGDSMTRFAAGASQWQDHVAQLALVVTGPHDLVAGLNYSFQSGAWSGPVIARRSAPDSALGPSTVRLGNGRVVSNPLDTPFRFAHPSRGEGQLRLPAYHALNLRIGKRFAWSGYAFEVSLDAFNITNHGADLNFTRSAHQTYSADYGRTASRQLPRSAQVACRLSY